ncbi:MAG: peptidylprolyl isomerase [Ignavibacteriales bacterium]
MKIFITLLSLITLTLSCSDFDKFYRQRNARTLNIKGGSAVVAKVGREEITKEDLIKSLENVPPNQRIIYLSSPQKLKEYLDSYINQIILYKEAERKGIDRREDIKENLERYRRRLLIQAIGQEMGGQKISEEDIKNYYNPNSKNLEQIRISHVFITAKGITKDEARAKAELVAKRARAGEKFENLVDQFSEDSTSKKRGGDIGYISRERLSPEIENKIFSLKEGEISDPIETENGFHVIKVTEGAKVPPLDQVKGRIEIDLKKRAFSEYTKRLREKMGVEIFEDNLKEISAK